MVSGRRLEFLRTLVEMSGESGGPVHYSELSARLGVSKWTAYDMLTALARSGLARATYATGTSLAGGRSQVFYEPTDRGREVLWAASDKVSIDGWGGEWHEFQKSLLSRFDLALGRNTDGWALLKETKGMSPMAYCAALLTALVVEFRKLNLDLALLRDLFTSGTEPATALPFLIGLLVGGLLATGVPKTSPTMEPLVKQFAESLKRMGDDNRDTLLAYTKMVLGRVDAT